MGREVDLRLLELLYKGASDAASMEFRRMDSHVMS